MQRRTFLLSCPALFVPCASVAYPAREFSSEAWREVRDNGRVAILNYRASWSLTCQIKADLIQDALAQIPAYRALTFVDVDWDTYGPSQLTQQLGVRRRSTLLVTKAGDEVARLLSVKCAPCWTRPLPHKPESSVPLAFCSCVGR